MNRKSNVWICVFVYAVAIGVMPLTANGEYKQLALAVFNYHDHAPPEGDIDSLLEGAGSSRSDPEALLERAGFPDPEALMEADDSRDPERREAESEWDALLSEMTDDEIVWLIELMLFDDLP